MQGLLEKLYAQLTESARSTNRIYKSAKATQPDNYFTYSWKLRKELRPAFQTKRISLQEILKLWIPKWKSEARLRFAPLAVVLNDKEAGLLGLPAPKEVDIYTLFILMMKMFKPIKN